MMEEKSQKPHPFKRKKLPTMYFHIKCRWHTLTERIYATKWTHEDNVSFGAERTTQRPVGRRPLRERNEIDRIREIPNDRDERAKGKKLDEKLRASLWGHVWYWNSVVSTSLYYERPDFFTAEGESPITAPTDSSIFHQFFVKLEYWMALSYSEWNWHKWNFVKGHLLFFQLL